MSITSVYKNGAYQAGDGHLEIRARTSKPAQDRLLVVCHGRTPAAAAGQACLQFAPTNAAGTAPPHLLYLAEAGYSIMPIDAGGNLTWGNAASVTALTNAIAYARANFASPTARIGLVGYSMGNLVALNYLRTVGQAAVAGIILEASPYDLDYFNANGYAAELTAAYPGGYAASSPKNFAGTITVPARLYACQDDPTVPYAQDQALLAALGSTDKQLASIPTGGHAPWLAVDPQALLAWLTGLNW